MMPTVAAAMPTRSANREMRGVSVSALLLVPFGSDIAEDSL